MANRIDINQLQTPATKELLLEASGWWDNHMPVELLEAADFEEQAVFFAAYLVVELNKLGWKVPGNG